MREDLAKEGACRGGTRPTGGRGMGEGGRAKPYMEKQARPTGWERSYR